MFYGFPIQHRIRRIAQDFYSDAGNIFKIVEVIVGSLSDYVTVCRYLVPRYVIYEQLRKEELWDKF